MHADDRRIVARQALVGEPEFSRLIPPQIVQNGITALNQPVKNRLTFGAFQIEYEAALVSIHALEEVAVVRAREEGPNPAPELTALGGILDLDHLRPKVCKIGGPKRPCAVLLDRNDFQIC